MKPIGSEEAPGALLPRECSVTQKVLRLLLCQLQEGYAAGDASFRKLNDLWRLIHFGAEQLAPGSGGHAMTLRWTWLGGGEEAVAYAQAGVWPGGRLKHTAWTRHQSLCIFGGNGYPVRIQTVCLTSVHSSEA